MSDAKLTHVTAKTAAEVTARYELEEPAEAVLTEQQTPIEFLNALTDKQLFVDACRFLAQALPKREAVYWAWLCAAPAPKGKKPDLADTALIIAEKWVLKPSQELCYQAKEASDAVGLKVPAGLAALAVFFSGESMTPPDLAAIPPPPHLTGVTAANTVILSVLLDDPKKANDNYRQVLDTGLEVARGDKRWKEEPPPEPPAARARR
jgi:hypothetical protein